jgi:hypothetical protein
LIPNPPARRSNHYISGHRQVGNPRCSGRVIHSCA